MGLLDAFKKDKKKKVANPADPQSMNMMQRMAMKKLEKKSQFYIIIKIIG